MPILTFSSKFSSNAFKILALGALSPLVYAQTTTLDKTIVGAEEAAVLDMTVINSLQIDTEVINDITDTVRHIAGIQVNDTGDRFGDNGFNIRGMEGDAIAITVDGVDQGETLSPPSFAPYGMFGSNRNAIELETVKAVEIVKGPNSIITGSGALAGSVAYITKDAEDFLALDGNIGGKLKAGYDPRTNETLTSAAMANRFGSVESLLIYTLRDRSEREAYGDGADIAGAERGLADPYNVESDSILAKLKYNLSDDQSFGVVYEKTNRDTTGMPLSRDSGTYFNFNTSDEMNRRRAGLFYDLENAGLAIFDTLSMTLDNQKTFSHGETAFSYSASFLPNDILRIEDRSYLQESVSFGIDFEKNIKLGDVIHELSYGYDYKGTEVENELFDIRHATVDRSSTQTQRLQDPSWVPKTDRESSSLYILDNIQVNEQLSFNLGLRQDSTEYTPKVDASFADPLGISVSDTDFSAFVGQVSAEYEFSPQHSISLSYGQGYKAPTTMQLYLDSNSGSTDGLLDDITSATFDDWDVISNPDLEAEESANIEVSYQWRGDRANLTVTAFNTEYENLIQSVSLNRPLGQTIFIAPVCGRFGCSDPVTTDIDEYSQAQNVGKVSVDGLEIEAEYFVTSDLSMSFSYSAVDGEYKDTLAGRHDEGDQLQTVSPDSAVFGLRYDSDAKWGSSAYLTWTDSKDESTELSFTALNNGSGPALFTGSSSVLDVSAYYNFSDSLSLTAIINNLTDKKYTRWEVVNSVRTGDGGFFSGVRDGGIDRFSSPGRSFSINMAYEF